MICFPIMPLHWHTVHVVFWTILYSLTENLEASPCAEVNSSSELVPFGSSVTASCYIKEECPLTKDPEFLIKWRKNAHFIPSSNGSQKNVYELTISNFTDMRATLECLICSDTCQVVGATHIRAVYPPSAPQNLTCLLNVNDPVTLMCTWEPGKNTPGIPTNFTLYTEIRDANVLQTFSYFPPPENNFYMVPREGFTLFQAIQVYVVAANALGQVTSDRLLLDPMTTAKLDAPVIQGVGTQTFGCLEYKWSLSPSQKWLSNSLQIEIKFKPMNFMIFNEEQFNGRPDRKIKLCGLLHGMKYESQLRVKYRESSPWSEWSNSTVATTPIRAPTGQLVTWLKIPRPESSNQTAQLFWKPSLQFRANSMKVSYIVSQEFAKKEIVCDTDQQHCSFQIHAKARKICLTAKNEAGKSSPTEVPVYRRRGMDSVPFLKIFPQSEESLLVKWKSTDSSSISGYVLEWKALCGVNLNQVSFEIVDRNQTSFVISGLEPYDPYEISVYPKYRGGIGWPNSTVAYTKQKAPSESPKLKIGKIASTFLELFWDKIPLQQRNGIITGYRIFYRDDKNNSGVIDTERTNRHEVLKDLHPFTTYEVFLMTSTQGGSVNGSTLTVKTAFIDAFEIIQMAIASSAGLIIFFLVVFLFFNKHKWVKKYLWPVIPDPANSNIKKWTTAGSLECIPPFKEIKDPVLVYLSHVSLLSLTKKELSKGDGNMKSSNWPYNGKSVDASQDDLSHDSETFDSAEQQSESVPYATVVFAGPYRHQPVPPPVYVRSESTQPLLGEEEPSSPCPYDKISTQTNHPDVDHLSTFHKNLSPGKENASLWVDFPMLSSLEIKSKLT